MNRAMISGERSRGMRVALMMCVISIGLGVPANEAAAGKVVNRVITQMTGLEPVMERMRVKVLRSIVGITGMKLLNPRAFHDGAMLDISDVVGDYRSLALLRRRIHFTKMRLHVRELTVVRNEHGALNLSALRVLNQRAAEPPREGQMTLAVDVLDLRIDRVVYKDYTRGDHVEVQEFDVHFIGRFERITGPDELVALIVGAALARTPLRDLACVGALRAEALFAPGTPFAPGFRSHPAGDGVEGRELFAKLGADKRRRQQGWNRRRVHSTRPFQ